MLWGAENSKALFETVLRCVQKRASCSGRGRGGVTTDLPRQMSGSWLMSPSRGHLWSKLSRGDQELIPSSADVLTSIVETRPREESFLFRVIVFQRPLFLRLWLHESVSRFTFKKFAAFAACGFWQIPDRRQRVTRLKSEETVLCVIFPPGFPL